MNPPPIRIGVLAGPTGVGKTRLSLHLAGRLGAEIVNADSMQVYRHMDIGTAKATSEERLHAPHHMLDMVDPSEPFDAAKYRELAAEAAAEIHARGRRILLVGGTGLYIKALLHGLFPAPASSTETRRAWKDSRSWTDTGALHDELVRVDPPAAAVIHKNDRVRILRALEVYHLTGTPISRLQARHAFGETRFRSLYVVLYRPRKELYQAVDSRVDRMMEEGLEHEVRRLRRMGYGWRLKPMQSIGYRHVGLHLQGVLSREEAVAAMKRDTRKFAKRQFTWFRSVPEAVWATPEQREDLERQLSGFFEGREPKNSRPSRVLTESNSI